MNDSNNNPYRPPQADLTQPPLALNTHELVAQPRSLPISSVFSWLSEGWRLYKKDWGVWLLISIIMFALTIVVGLIAGFIPIIGNLISSLFIVILTGGLYIGVNQSTHGGKLDVSHLFVGFKQALVPLILIGLISSLLSLGTGLLTGALTSTPIPVPAMSDSADISPEQAIQTAFANINGGALFVDWLISSLIGLLIWFTIPLVTLHQIPLLEALKLSIKGAVHNIIALIIYMFISFVLVIIGAIPVGLGLLVVMPWLLCSNYISYQQIFTDSPEKL